MPKAIVAQNNVREVLRYVETGSADAGIVYESDTKKSKQVKIVAIAPEKSHSPIVFTVAILKNSKNIAEAKKFVRFLVREENAVLFKRHGFIKIKSK